MKCNAFKCGCGGRQGWHEDKYRLEQRRKEEETNIEVALDEVAGELRRAISNYPPFHSAHEGVAIIDEEMREFRDAAYWPHKEETGDEEEEAMQLAAMAIRYLVDICYKEDAPR